MKKENAKTKLGQFVSENYTTMSAFARSVNIELSNALASLEKNKDAVTEIAKQWN